MKHDYQDFFDEPDDTAQDLQKINNDSFITGSNIFPVDAEEQNAKSKIDSQIVSYDEALVLAGGFGPFQIFASICIIISYMTGC